MPKTIDLIIERHPNIFGKNPKVEKITIGFTNTIYKINDSFIVKICTNPDNEEKFKHEIDFYNANKGNNLIPKLYYSNIDKKEIPYYYEILEKIEGKPLYSVWHTYTEEQRENIIKQLCAAMKEMHKKKGQPFSWPNYMKTRYNTLISEANSLGIFNDKEQELLKEAYSKFDKYLESDEFVLVHNDLHFDNIFVHKGKIKIIDFERSLYAPRDFELDIIYRMIRKPWKFASEEIEQYTKPEQYSNIIKYITKYYPELVSHPYLYKRLAIYDLVYYLAQLIEYPNLEELKKDTLSAATNI